jgi:predicted lipid-binding transport protein (Tim44 family)
LLANTSSGLSTGAKAGIGIGAALGALALLGLIIFLFMRRRKKQQQQAPYEAAAYEAPRPQEMDGESPRVEMSHAPDPIAKVAPGKVHELPGSTNHYA